MEAPREHPSDPRATLLKISSILPPDSLARSWGPWTNQEGAGSEAEKGPRGLTAKNLGPSVDPLWAKAKFSHGSLAQSDGQEAPLSPICIQLTRERPTDHPGQRCRVRGIFPLSYHVLVQHQCGPNFKGYSASLVLVRAPVWLSARPAARFSSGC
ncbi:hypothetical protein VUR80DRAFT_5260 [Thermomyces stellatus]